MEKMPLAEAVAQCNLVQGCAHAYIHVIDDKAIQARDPADLLGMASWPIPCFRRRWKSNRTCNWPQINVLSSRY